MSYRRFEYRRWPPSYVGSRRYRTLWDEEDWSRGPYGRSSVIECKPEEELYITNNYGSNVLTVQKVDLKIAKNTEDHKTNEYEMNDSETLVVRRGQPFQLAFTFNKPFDKNKHDLRFVFEFGKKPNQTKGTHVSIDMSAVDKPKKWGAKIDKQSGNTMTVNIFTPPNCFVGEWSLAIDQIKKDENKVFRFKHEKKVVILFNPWCPDDTVHMNAQDLNEYVLNQTGRIYVGNKNKISGRPWNFGQFQKNVLDCALYLLDEHSGMADTARGDPVKTVRKISSLANSSDNDGVLTGRWDGNYVGGTRPTSWRGSVRILEQYYRTKHPVRYGQCWVFSGIVTTLCRTLGIPARSVTNFCSAHDTDGSVSIEKLWSENGEPIPSPDSVWNFHVWNDVWMTRPDLCQKFGGWQAIDATPQEASDGVYCCGPYPLEAIKEGKVNEQYDGRFIFAEVNADICDCVEEENGNVRKVRTRKREVGQFISTKIPIGRKEPGITKNCKDPRREDVTREYKFPEGSQQERDAVQSANLDGAGAGSDDEEDTTVNDVEFKLLEKEAIYLGQDYDVVLQIRNDSKETRTIKGCISSSSCYYTGVKYATISKMQLQDLKVKPGEVITKKMLVTYEDYRDKIIDQCEFKLSCNCTVAETKQTYQNEDDFQLLKPEINISVPREVKAGKPFIAKLSFENPLKTLLLRCKFQCEGPLIQQNVEIKLNSVDPKGTAYAEVELIAAKKAMEAELIVSFDSDELDDVSGTCDLIVKS